jgi:ABC-2 type transport system permease protein
MSILTKIATTEAKLMLRDFATPFFAIAFPPILLAGVSLISPGFTEVVVDDGDAPPEFVGIRPIDIYVPVVVTVAIATTALTILPAYLAVYRERGVLRRIATTPASPRDLLSAQGLVNAAFLTVGTLATILVGVIVFDVPWPANVVGFVVSFLLATASMAALGLIIAALAPNGRIASGIGTALFFVSMLFAGVWTPGAAMPDGLRAIADFTPMGAAAEAMTATWDGAWPSALHLIVMAAWAVGTTAVAARLFRWE